MRVLIAGGGVAGAATAMAVRRAGHEPVVFEAHRGGGADAGAFLVLMANGMAALREIGADGPVAEASVASTGLELVAPDGTIAANRSYEDGSGPRTITRAALYRVLQEEAVRRGIPVRHGKRLVGAEHGADGVTAWFADGTSATGDILVGADGLRSLVRRLIDPAVPEPRYTGISVVYGYARDVAAAPGIYRMVQGRFAAFGCTTGPDRVTSWFARVPDTERSREEIAATTPAGWRELASSVFCGTPAPGRQREQASPGYAPAASDFRGESLPPAEIIAASGDEVFGDHAYDLPSVPNWSTPRMVLVGDAVHAFSPAAAAGASMAIEDAATLAECLRTQPDAPAAFAAYEAERREPMEKLVAAALTHDAERVAAYRAGTRRR
ncbi:FAD-dependent monooxygenase [Amycolatopsis sp. NPDC059021]|uniref:FAD-dependent monooxygenase n=1 Tax=Amycolatopsis sp. NPDC059021 TaxID=3346704 RepID=UPI00366BCA26